MDLLAKEFDTFIENLPEQHNNRNFENQITKFIISYDESQNDLLKECLQTRLSENKDTVKGFIAFLCLATFYRRKERAFLLETLFQEYEQYFEQYPLLGHYRSLKYRANDDLQNSFLEALNVLHSPDLQNHSGILHNFAEITITLIEENESFPTGTRTERLDEAFHCLERAIRLERDYAKFHATKARFHLYKKEFTAAKDALKLAINYEKKGSDFQLRVSKYYQLLGIVQVQEEYERNKQIQDEYNEEIKTLIEEASMKMDKQIQEHEENYRVEKKETKKMLESMKEQNLQMLGFFTAIISFTIGSFQIVKNQSLHEALLLLIALAGILLIAYAGFSFLIFKSDRETLLKNGIVLVFSLFLILFAILAYQNQWIGEINTIAYYKNL